MRHATGLILWEGLSLIDRKTPIVCIATGVFGRGSSNRKTGAMVQTYIIRADVPPHVAVASRDDGAICGGCVHRKQANGRRTCYVNVGQGPLSVYRAYKRKRYNTTDLAYVREVMRGRNVRLGTYGDPAAVPLAVWEALTAHASGHTGYTHQWRAKRFSGLARFCQASCETSDDVANAHAMGYRGTFRVVPLGEALPAKALHCPASAERGHLLQCHECRACNGTRDVVIMAHGPARNFYSGKRELPVLAA